MVFFSLSSLRRLTMSSAQQEFDRLRVLQTRAQQWALLKGLGIGIFLGLLTHLVW
jgi:hypothetical protein